MSKYFIFKEPPPSEDIAKIREYLEQIGELHCSNKQLEALWDEFSDSWCASWLIVNDKTLKRFSYWLEEYDEE